MQHEKIWKTFIATAYELLVCSKQIAITLD